MQFKLILRKKQGTFSERIVKKIINPTVLVFLKK